MKTTRRFVTVASGRTLTGPVVPPPPTLADTLAGKKPAQPPAPATPAGVADPPPSLAETVKKITQQGDQR